MSKKERLPSRPSANPLLREIKELIEQSRQQAAVAVNSAISMLYWNIGKRINDELLQNRRADYGEQIQCRLLKDWRLQVASAIFYFCLFIDKMPRHSKLLG